jgi:hypothetical protein
LLRNRPREERRVECHFECHREEKSRKQRQTDENAGIAPKTVNSRSIQQLRAKPA